MGAFFGSAGAAEAPVPPMGTLATGGSTGPILTPPDSGPIPQQVAAPVQVAAAPSTLVDAPAQPTQVAMNTPGGGANNNQAQIFDQRFKGTPLEGKWDVIKSTAESRGVPPVLAAAVMAQETGNGRNVKFNNPAGLMDPATKMMSKQQFSSIDKGIDAAVGVIEKNYKAANGDLGRMAARYAPVGAANDTRGLNKDWLPGVKKIADQFGGI
jgi:hypothetical protein